MKTNHLHYIVLLATIFLGCSCSEEIEKELTTGKTAVTIEVDGEEDADSRTVSFIGGTAYGEGLYDGKERPTVGAEASDGYEIDYFYGGPSDEPQKYNYTGSGSSVSYQVFLNGKDHKFKCKFKEKKRTLTLTANPTSGGTVTGGGTYKVKTNIPITAVAKSGYTFSGWTVTKGDAKIMNASSASTTVQLQSSNSTLQANFSKAGKTFYFSIRTGRGKLDVFDERGETTLLPSASEIVLNLSPDDENLERGGYLISPEPESGWKYGEDEWYVNGNRIPSGQYGQYLFTYNDYSRYPDGSRFVYDFKADNPIKVTIQTGMWSNNSFSLYTHGDFRIGFSATGLSSGQQTREFSYGDRVTIYADGADYAVPGEGDRWRYNYLRGFFTTRWQALDDLGEYSQTSAGSYSFTATKDITINIVFMPTIR